MLSKREGGCALFGWVSREAGPLTAVVPFVPVLSWIGEDGRDEEEDTGPEGDERATKGEHAFVSLVADYLNSLLLVSGWSVVYSGMGYVVVRGFGRG